MLMSVHTFYVLLAAMCGVAVVVFVTLFFVRAGYGLFRSARWGPSVDNRIGWVLMEAPVFVVMLWLWAGSAVRLHAAPLVFFLLFELHYFQRSFVFPLLLRGKGRLPLTILLMGVVFNVLNGFIQGVWLFYLAPADRYPAAWLAQPAFLIGVVVFFAGMAINLHSDHVIRHLRRKGDTRHYLPQRGLYRYVTSANYFGELVEWVGFAVLTSSPAAWVFVVWTFANLAPRAHAIRERYYEEFGRAAVGRRKRLLPFVY